MNTILEKDIKRQEAKSIWAHSPGTEKYHAYPINSQILFYYTDGAALVAEKLEAYWLLDIVMSILPVLSRQEFVSIILKVSENNRAVFVADDGNNNVIYSQNIKYTDFPSGEWKFFYIDKILLLSSEY